MPQEPERGPRRGWRASGRPLRLAGIGACVLVLLVAVAGLTGGLDELPEPELPAVAVAEVSSGQPWNVAVTAAHLFRELGWTEPREEGNHLLVVVAEVEVTADESRRDIRNALYPDGVAGLVSEWGLVGLPDDAVGADWVVLVRDGTEIGSLHPGLAERVAFIWERSGDGPAPAEITVTVTGMTLRENTLTGRVEWLDPAPRVRVTVPVRDRRDEAEQS